MKLGRTLIVALSTLALLLLIGVPLLRRVLSPAPSPAPPRRVLHVEPAPLPEGLLFVGPEGDREDGWPRRSVDRTALLALLRAGRHRELTEQLESLQTTFEADPRKERWINEAMLAFRQADPALDAPIEAWVAAEPASFAPFLARCAHLDAVAWARRGSRTVRDTPAEALEAMREAMTRAVADCERALALRPHLVVARQRLITIAHAAGIGDPAQQLALALRSCPTCFRVRAVELGYLVPRWGGSLDQMSASAEAAIREHPEAPYLRALAGLRPEEECEQLSRDDGSLDAALARCGAAVAAGEEWSFYRARANVHELRNDTAAAIADLEHALEIDPQVPELLVAHARLVATTRPEQAIAEYLTAARLDPLARGVEDGITWARERARSLAIDAAIRGEAGGIERAQETARALGVSPDELEAWQRELAGIQPLAAELAASPDSIDVHRRMDAALLQMGASAQILAMWDRYLERHPDDGHAWLERGGTHFVRRELPEAAHDARRACELGVAEGCQRAQQLGAQP